MIETLISKLSEYDAEIIHLGQFDYASIFRERRLRKKQFLDWAQDPRFANVLAHWDASDALFGGSRYYTEEQEIDLGSIRHYPGEPNAIALICEAAGASKEIMPRQVLRRQIERAASLGYRVKAAFEFEYILLNETAESVREQNFSRLAKFAPDNKCWSGTTAATHAELVAGMEAEALGFDIELFGLGVELGAGCFEATLGAVDGLKAADDAAFFRLAMRSFARKNGLTASFMPYLGDEYPGIGGHLTLSLWDVKTDENLFASPDGQTNDIARNFIAGMLDIVPQAFAMCTSSVNAYRRLAPGSWAPKSVTWADYTFTTALRSVPSTGDQARLEFRSPPSDCNPYLTMALMLGAGLEGMEKELKAPPPADTADPDHIPDGAERFPRDLADAADRLECSEVSKHLFGAPFVENFVQACRVEDASLRTAVSSAERQRYLEG